MTTFFNATRPGREVSVGTMTFEVPVLYFRDDSFGAMFSADLKALQALMPSDKLHPIPLLRPGRGCLYIGAFDYHDTSAGPYGEVAVLVPAVHGRKPPPLAPALLESRWPDFGALVLHLPVTTLLARDGGRVLWGYTKFVADMTFEITPELLECTLSEGGQHILTLHVTKRGIALPDHRPIVTYSVRDGELVKTTIPQTAIVRTALGAGGSSLALGESHPVAASLRALDIDPRPLMTRYYADRYAILPEGEVIERGVRPLVGYLGADRARGQLDEIHLPRLVH